MKAGLRACAAALLALAAAACLAQAGYPSRPVRIILPFGPGTSSDAVLRALSTRLAEQMKVPVVVENREGAGGRIGAAAVASAPADGYTLLLATNPPFVVAPLIQKRPAYDAAADFTAVTKIASIPMVLVASNKAPFADFAGMETYARRNPGKLDYASAGIGVPSHLFMEQFKRSLGLHITFIPYRATGQMYTDVVAGHVPLAMLALGAARPYIQSGELRGLAMGSPARSNLMQAVPTFQEVTSKKELAEAISIWIGILGPPGLPADIAARLDAEIRTAVQSPDVAAVLAAQGATLSLQGPAAFDAELRRAKQASAELLADLKLLASD
jgi:tripartite-type tricarboxylate transporter receptor subunit TctC